MLQALACLLALASPGPDDPGDALAAVEVEQVALFERVAAGVVVISQGQAVGAGFAVAPGIFLTAAHVVQDAGQVEVVTRDGTRLRGEVVRGPGAELDLALVRTTPPPSVATLELSDAPRPRTGSLVATVGHDDGNRWSFSTGIVSNAEADGPDGTLLRLQLPIRPGASGGPVVDRAGRVVGMITTGGPGVAFAVRARLLLRALERLTSAPLPAPGGEAIAELSGAPRVAPQMIVAPADPRPLAGSAPEGRKGQTGGARPTPW